MRNCAQLSFLDDDMTNNSRSKSIISSILIGALGALSFASSAPAQTSKLPEYGIKRDTPSTGTRLKEDRILLKVPPESNWAELSAAQKAYIKSSYHDMPEQDEPPYPIGGVKALYKAISDAQGQALVDGDLLAVANVDATGKVIDVNIYKTPSEPVAKAIAAFLFLQKFKPAVCGGKPCAMEYALNLGFRTQG